MPIKLQGTPGPHHRRMESALATRAPAVGAELLGRLDVPGPRYTSYPTADRFGPAFGAADYRAALQRRAAGPAAAPLSVYVHVPFCESVCYYCACNKIVTRQHGRASAYLQTLEREIALHVAEIGTGQAVSQLHLGGGTPTFLDDAELTGLMRSLRGAFAIGPDAEISIEVDPRTVDRGRLEQLAALGFNRLSFGVQDFDPAVQHAVHRIQPYEAVRALMEAARAIGFRSTNVDLIYGLPMQTPASFARTLEQVCTLEPERIALYAYAHLPQRFKPQRRIDATSLPGAAARVAMLAAAIARFGDAGYVYVGMDHFARPDDPLAVAKREGRLHRNFQGYSTQPDCDLIGLGVSAIGKVGDTYAQNAKTLDAYSSAIATGHFAVERGLCLNADDRLRRDAIMALMCQGRLDFATLEQAHSIRFADRFADELRALEPLQANGLVERHATHLEVTALGWFFVRSVASVFDGYLQRGAPASTTYSRAV